MPKKSMAIFGAATSLNRFFKHEQIASVTLVQGLLSRSCLDRVKNVQSTIVSYLHIEVAS